MCVASGGTFQPGYLNNSAGHLVVDVGKATLPGLALNTGFRLGNLGTTTFASAGRPTSRGPIPDSDVSATNECGRWIRWSDPSTPTCALKAIQRRVVRPTAGHPL